MNESNESNESINRMNRNESNEPKMINETLLVLVQSVCNGNLAVGPTSSKYYMKNKMFFFKKKAAEKCQFPPFSAFKFLNFKD